MFSITNLTGIKPTGLMHLGNEYGMQFSNSEFIMIADGHAFADLQTFQDNELYKIDETTAQLVRSLMVIAPNCYIYRQTDIPEIFILFWILLRFTKKGQMDRMHVFKAMEKDTNINIATYTYSVLMAADIIIAGSNNVQIGIDQKQHIELAKYLIAKLSLKQPNFIFTKETLLGFDGRKMSKSYNNYIPSICKSKDELMQYINKFITNSSDMHASKPPESMYQIIKSYVPEKFKAFALLYDNQSWRSIKEEFCSIIWDKISNRICQYNNISDTQIYEHLATSAKIIQAQSASLIKNILKKNL